MKINRSLPFLALLLLTTVPFLAARLDGAEEEAKMTSIYDYPLVTIDGKKTTLADHKDKVLLIVNVASECGATPQYANLVSLHEKLAGRGLVVLGFPANNFGGQEPGTDTEIAQFCTREYQVSFPLFGKVSVAGDDQHPLFKHLTTAKNADFTGPIRWNFEKFLIGRDGLLLRRFRTGTEPDAPEVIEDIEKALDAVAPGGDSGGCKGC